MRKKLQEVFDNFGEELCESFLGTPEVQKRVSEVIRIISDDIDVTFTRVPDFETEVAENAYISGIDDVVNYLNDLAKKHEPTKN